MWKRLCQPAVQQALPPRIFQEWRERYRGRPRGGRFLNISLSLYPLIQAFQTETNRGERRKKYSLQEEFVRKTKKESNNPFRKFLKSKTMKAQSLDGDLDFADLSLFGSVSIIECSCGHNSCPNCNLTYMWNQIKNQIKDNQKYVEAG